MTDYVNDMSYDEFTRMTVQGSRNFLNAAQDLLQRYDKLQRALSKLNGGAGGTLDELAAALGKNPGDLDDHSACLSVGEYVRALLDNEVPLQGNHRNALTDFA